jgi:hypothetical protein
MNRIVLGVLVLLQLACLPIELSAQSQTEAAKSGASTVSGTVIAKGMPFRNATVLLQAEQPAGSQARASLIQGQTDDNGVYKITGLSAGRYRITASMNRFIMNPDQALVQEWTLLNIGEGENIENLELELKRGGVITGRVTCANRPLVEETVQLLRLDQNGKPRNFMYDFIIMGRTDDRGRYRIYGLPEGRYLAGVGISRLEGFNLNGAGLVSPNLRSTFHPDVAEQSEAKVIEVADGSETADVDIAVAEANKTYSIYGRVISAEDGQPVSGIELAFGSIARDGQRIGSLKAHGVRSNAKGEFRFEGVLPGKHAILANPDQENGVVSEIEICEVRDSDLRGVEVKIRPGNTISGRVVIEGTSDPAILANITQIRLAFSTRSAELEVPVKSWVMINPEGGFRIRAIKPGNIDIQIMTGLRGFSILRYERDGTPVLPQEGLAIAPGEKISNLRVVVGYSQGEGK